MAVPSYHLLIEPLLRYLAKNPDAVKASAAYEAVANAVGVIALTLMLFACGPAPHSQPPRRAADDSGNSGSNARSTDPPPPERRARHRVSHARTEPPIIDATGVGTLRLGRPIPPPYLRPAVKPERTYVLGFHADAQTYEGFRFPKTGVLVLITKGPFYAWFEDPKRPVKGKPDAATTARLALSAVKHARAGKPIGWILIDHKGVRTSKGIGVGSTLVELTRAYGALTLSPTPPDFGRDRCGINIKPLRNVWAYFESCPKARAGGRVTRMSIWLPRP